MSEYAIKPISEIRPGKARLLNVAKFSYGRFKFDGVMLQDFNGDIYYTGRKTDIREENTECRRAWCRLTGTRNKDLDAEVKSYKKAQEAESKDDAVKWLRSEASRLGYDILERK